MKGHVVWLWWFSSLRAGTPVSDIHARLRFSKRYYFREISNFSPGHLVYRSKGFEDASSDQEGFPDTSEARTV